MIHNKIHLSSPGCPWPRIALVKNRGLKPIIYFIKIKMKSINQITAYGHILNRKPSPKTWMYEVMENFLSKYCYEAMHFTAGELCVSSSAAWNTAAFGITHSAVREEKKTHVSPMLLQGSFSLGEILCVYKSIVLVMWFVCRELKSLQTCRFWTQRS